MKKQGLIPMIILILLSTAVNAQIQIFGTIKKEIPPPSVDTVKVAMLTSDSTGLVMSSIGFVRREYNPPSSDCLGCEGYHIYTHYMDKRKKPLRKDLIIWMSEEIK